MFLVCDEGSLVVVVSMLLTVNTGSHNPAQKCSDNIPSLPPDNHHHSDVVKRRGGEVH